MKKFIYLFIIPLSLFSYENYTNKLDYIVDNIESYNTTLNVKQLSKINDPFIIKKKKTTISKKSGKRYGKFYKSKKRLPFGVQGIFDNAVLVSGKWYKKGQYINKKFLVKNISKNRVDLKNRYSKKIYKIKIGELNEKVQINIF